MLPGVLLQAGIHTLSQHLNSLDILQAPHVRIEEDDGPQTSQLSFVHLHLLYLGDELNQNSVKDVSKTTGVGILSGDNDSIGKLNAVLDIDRSVCEAHDQQLIPASLQESDLQTKYVSSDCPQPTPC